jgi:kynurenine formamidase
VKLLVIGGTAFVGRAIVEAALERGDAVTYFHFGVHNRGLHPGAREVLGDRATDVARVSGGSWDAVVDTCGYDAAAVGCFARTLAAGAGLYAFISSVSGPTGASRPGASARCSPRCGRSIPARSVQIASGGSEMHLTAHRQKLALVAGLLLAVAVAAPAHAARPALWRLYDKHLQRAKYVDLTHTITPAIPVWSGFGPSTFSPAVIPSSGQPYTYAVNGFEATRYLLQTDQLGTQLDPPAHWAPEYAAIDELPATYAVRPLVVISIARQVAQDFNYALTVADVRAWERRHGRIPSGSVVMVRSDWSKRWPDPELAKLTEFPGVSLDALKFLHNRRHILFHGHEPLDTDSTPTLEGEDWLMHHGYAQAEGVANLDQVPQKGALVEIGYPKFGGGLGGYARFVAICPPNWRHGVSVGDVPEAPLERFATPLHYDASAGMRLR